MANATSLYSSTLFWIHPPSSQSVSAAIPSWQTGEHPKLYNFRGAHYDRGETTFQVHAPNARKVAVILTAHGKEENRLEMSRNEFGDWEARTRLAPPGRTYQYLVEDCHGKTMLRTDPFSFSQMNIPEVDQIQSVVVNSRQFEWKDQHWMQERSQMNPSQRPLSIYEIQAKSWKSGFDKPLNFRTMAPELIHYCRSMGFTHVELYGILEHFFRPARGYQVSNYFTPYRDCGNCEDFKYMVDQLHQNGIGVIIDWIPTHFQHYHQTDSYSVSMHDFDGTNLFAAEASPWGTLYLDYSKEETRRLMLASALYFLDKCHIDGIRFDAISQMVHRNGNDIPEGISFLKELNDMIHSCYPGVLTIAEETEGFPNVTKPTVEGGLGFDMKWNIGWSHDSRNFLRTPYSERPKHWHHKILNFLNSVKSGERVILSHSHDDTDAGENSNEKVLLNCVSHAPSDLERFSDLKNFFAWQALAPSRGSLLHMGDELVQADSWYQRMRKNISSVDWELSHIPAHQAVQTCIKDLHALYLEKAQFWKHGEQDFSLIAEQGTNCVLAYHRGIFQNKRIAVIHNFSNQGYSSYDIPFSSIFSDSEIARISKVNQIFNSDNSIYGGTGNFENREIELLRSDGIPTHLRIALPPLSTIVIEEELIS